MVRHSLPETHAGIQLRVKAIPTHAMPEKKIDWKSQKIIELNPLPVKASSQLTGAIAKKSEIFFAAGLAISKFIPILIVQALIQAC